MNASPLTASRLGTLLQARRARPSVAGDFEFAPGGFLATLLLGVVGAVVGGWLGSVLLKTGLGGFFDIRTWLLAIGGSLVVLLVYGALTGRSSKR